VTWYTFFKSVHVITAVIWVGGAAMIQAYAFRILRTGDGKRQADVAKDTAMLVGIAAVLAFYARGAQRVSVPAPE
jgi:uncharacterized membrane protein